MMMEKGSVSVRVPECCMCGDYGLSSELFRCKDCRFRSQHKYCSNEYPEAESYDICNWCLSKKNDRRKEEINTKFSPNSSSISHQNQNDHDMKMMNKRKRVLGDNHDKGLKNIKITNSNKIIKNHKKSSPTPDQSRPLAGGRKRIIATDHAGGISHNKRIIRRTRSEDQMSNGGIVIKQVFRNKVRRYKLLDEVSS